MRKIFAILYSVIVVVVVCSFYKSPLFQLFVKPLLTVSLLIYYFFQLPSKLTKEDKLLIAGLILGLIGDLVVIDESNLEIGILFFIYMLGCYYHSLREEGTRILFDNKHEFIKVLPIILFTFLFFGFTILTRVPIHLLWLSVIYAFLILLFLIIVWLRKSSPRSYAFGLLSSWGFALSSALFSYRQFSLQFRFDMILIILLYALAQYSFVQAKLEHHKFKNQI